MVRCGCEAAVYHSKVVYYGVDTSITVLLCQGESEKILHDDKSVKNYLCKIHNTIAPCNLCNYSIQYI